MSVPVDVEASEGTKEGVGSEKEEEDCNFECCNASFQSFKCLLDHLTDGHGIYLKPVVDLCHTCEIIFNSVEEGIEHYISHAISFEGRMVSLGGEIDIKAQNWLTPIYEKMKEVRKDILHHLIFGDDGK